MTICHVTMSKVKVKVVRSSKLEKVLSSVPFTIRAGE